MCVSHISMNNDSLLKYILKREIYFSNIFILNLKNYLCRHKNLIKLI